MNVARLALDSIEEFGEYESIRFDGRAYSNVERDLYASRLATVLADHGVRPGDRVVVMMPNSPDVLAAFQAIWKIGGVILPLTPQLQTREVQFLIEHSGASLVLTRPDLSSRLEPAVAEVAHCRHLLVLGATASSVGNDIGAMVASAPAHPTLVDRDDDDLALLIYTSGTTGAPKGVMLSHRNVMTVPQAKMVELPPYMPTLHVLPLSHSYGVLMMNLGFMKGMASTLLPRWETRSVFETIEEREVQRFSMVPTMLTYMSEFSDRERYDTSSLKKVWLGGAPLPDQVRVEFERIFECEVSDGYGLSECCAGAATYWDGDRFRTGSVGRAMAGVDLRVVDDSDRPVDSGKEGEILVRGDNVMLGYWKNEAATAETLRGGWLHTGDIGHLDEEGFLYITDRKKDIIIKGGENLSPREIEEVIHRHPAVAEVTVVGVPHPTYGEEPWAAVSLKSGAQATEDEIRNHVGTHLTRFKIPARVVLLPELPKSRVGKILKREIRDRLTTAREAEG